MSTAQKLIFFCTCMLFLFNFVVLGFAIFFLTFTQTANWIAIDICDKFSF